MFNDERPIVIVKKKVSGGGHHGGAWKVAYADFVTAMMAFFLVMWILGLNQETREGIANYFKDPIGFMRSGNGATASPILSSQGSDAPAVTTGDRSILESASEKERLLEVKKEIEEAMEGLPELEKLREFIDIEMSAEGLRIELLEGSEGRFFEIGSAAPKPETVRVLRLIGSIVRKAPAPLVLEGHTDARPYSNGTNSYGNFELSADRAMSARRILAPLLRTNQIIKVEGYADRRPRNATDPYHFSNRRVSLLLPYARMLDPGRLTELKPGIVGDAFEVFKRAPGSR